MIQNIVMSGHVKYGLAEYVIDTLQDVDDLPIDVPAGSTAFCIATTDVFMLNNLGEWVKL